MTELRRLRGLLRKSDGEPSLAPRPGLSRFGDLVAEVREAGAEFEVPTDGNLAAIPKGLDQSAYRIVQECLTNMSSTPAHTGWRSRCAAGAAAWTST